MKITREHLKNIVRESMVEESAYQAFFKKALEKTGKSIPDMSDEEKKAFFNKIDSAWKGKGEKKNEGNAFGAAVSQAKKDGDDSFKVDGEEYKVEGNHSNEEEEIDEEAAMVHRRTPSGTIVSKLKEENESVNEGKKRFKRQDGIGKSKYTISYHDGKKKHKDGSDFFDIKIFKNKKDLSDFVGSLVKQGYKLTNESVNESASKEAMGIAGFTGTRGSAVEDFINQNELNGKKLFQYVKKGGLKQRMEFVSAIAGKPGNALQKMIISKFKLGESTNERMGSDKGEVGNANFNNRLKAMRDDKNSVVVYIDTNKGKKLLKVFKTQQTAQQFKKKNMDKLLNTKGVESVGTMPKKEWDAKEAKYAIK